VALAGVGFRYPCGRPAVLDGLDLVLPAGRCTAVVGVNGAGKTTLVKLLTRLYEPTAGRITVDGTDLRALPVDGWRRQVSVVFQDFVRYELTAAENIACGAVHLPPDRDAVRAAAARAGVLDVLERLPRGLDTVLSRAHRGGAELSGGQWQRVAIARSLYALDAGARLLILDEPTAALDVRAEAAFFDSFVALTRGVTSVLISHRFSSVRRADRVAVLDGGRVVELGGHAELLASEGHYARLFRLQAERFAAGLTAEGEPDERRFALPSGGAEPSDRRAQEHGRRPR
jgi:ATP-binding cassette subfamily B protein